MIYQSSIQTNVHNLIVSFGGYFAPLAGIVRITEELGELSLLVDLKNNNKICDDSLDELAEELADLAIMACCLANQYCCYLNENPKIDNKISLNNYSLINGVFKLLNLSSQLSRRVMHYENLKKPKNKEEFISVYQIINEFYKVVYLVGKSYNINIIDEVNKKLDKSKTRDKNRFGRNYDPVSCENSELLNNSIKYINDLNANYKDINQYWASPSWDRGIDSKLNINETIRHLHRFLLVSEYEGPEAYFILIPKNEKNLIQAKTTLIDDISKILEDTHFELIDIEREVSTCKDYAMLYVVNKKLLNSKLNVA